MGGKSMSAASAAEPRRLWNRDTQRRAIPAGQVFHPINQGGRKLVR
jgi:hypothetical protein